jgi:hypothetical protein
MSLAWVSVYNIFLRRYLESGQHGENNVIMSLAWGRAIRGHHIVQYFSLTL